MQTSTVSFTNCTADSTEPKNAKRIKRSLKFIKYLNRLHCPLRIRRKRVTRNRERGGKNAMFNFPFFAQFFANNVRNVSTSVTDIQALIASPCKSSPRRGEKFPILLSKVKKKRERERERRLCVSRTRSHVCFMPEISRMSLHVPTNTSPSLHPQSVANGANPTRSGGLINRNHECSRQWDRGGLPARCNYHDKPPESALASSYVACSLKVLCVQWLRDRSKMVVSTVSKNMLDGENMCHTYFHTYLCDP